MELARYQASLSSFAGVSRIRTDREERVATVKDDAIVGHMGAIALHRYLHGEVSGYVKARYLQNRYPNEGDGGEDILGCNVDVKTSLMRYSTDPAKYHLLVRPKERHPDWVYVHALVPMEFDQPLPKVLLTGWLTDAELPATPYDGPKQALHGAYCLPVPELHPLPPIRYRFIN